MPKFAEGYRHLVTGAHLGNQPTIVTSITTITSMGEGFFLGNIFTKKYRKHFFMQSEIFNNLSFSQVTSGIDSANIGPMLLKFTPNSSKTNDEYYEPWGVAADPEGLYVVSDHHNHRIQVFYPM